MSENNPHATHGWRVPQRVRHILTISAAIFLIAWMIVNLTR